MDADELSLLSLLQSSTDIRHIHNLISSHLRPFQTLISPNPKKPDTRPLAKRYLSFLNRALSIIPNRLSETQLIDSGSADSLFESYKLALDCLQCISSQLSCKPYMVHLQRARLIRCYESWERYADGEREGVFVLDGLRKLGLGVSDGDRDLAGLVAELVVTVVKCVYMKGGKKESDYRSVLRLVDEVGPWLRVLDASAHEKFQRVLVTYLTKCTVLLAGELKSSNKDLVREFLFATFAECRRLSGNDHLYKFASRVCSSLFSLQDDQSSNIMDILSCVLDIIAIEFKGGDESTTIEFLELVSYCANKCQIATKHLCSELATHIKKLAGDSQQVDLILRLYSTGLSLNTTTIRSNISGSINGFLLDKDEVLHDLSNLLGVSKSNSLPTIKARKNSAHKMCTDTLICKAGEFCQMKNDKLFLLPFCNALKFVCQPLAEAINSARNEIFAQVGVSFSPSMLFTIRDVFLFCLSTLNQKSIAVDHYDRTMLDVAVAALTLSFRTNSYIQESVKVIKQVISAARIQVDGLKFLCACIYNVGVTLYRSYQMKEAAMAMKLCCRAAWTCVSRLLSASSADESEVHNFVNEACAKSVFLLDLLSKCNDHNKVKKVIKSSLQKWSAAANVFTTLSSPSALVKQWVKIECKLCKDPGVEGGALSLYSLLSSCTSVSETNLRVILEHELSSYNEVRALNPKLCNKMQMNIIEVLLTKVTNDRLQRSKLLITKGRELRTSGFEGLDACIRCLSEAIPLLLFEKNDVNGERDRQPAAINHHLAVAYALRALCMQEAEPNSEILSKDIEAALKLWLSKEYLADEQCDMAYEEVLIILYHVIDMLSLKGCTKCHSDIYELLIKLFKKKKIPLTKCMALLWQCRRLSDALCPSPLNEASILAVSGQFEEPSQYMNFWEKFFNGSLSLETGFWQRLSCLSKTKVDDVKQAALNLTSSVPLSSDSAFFAAHLYYDLCERMISYGRLSEALSFAKEAHRLRSKVLRENYRHSTNQQSEINDETGETVKKNRFILSYFQIHSSVATTVWPQDKRLLNFEDTILTPWNVLQCYLESTLQVGIVHELMGYGSEAESLLVWGKSISILQGLPLFELVFSSVLGRVYRKKELWDQARDELLRADKVLENSFSCSKCRLLMEATINLERGDLFRSRKNCYTGNIYASRVCKAEKRNKKEIDKLNCSEWKNSVHYPEDSRDDAESCYKSAIDKLNCSEWKNSVSNQHQGVVPETKTKNSRTTKNPVQNQRTTRSKYRSQTSKENAPCEEIHVGPTEQTNNEHRSLTSETCSNSVEFGTGMSCFCNKKKCWYCLHVEVMQSGSLDSLLLMKWEFSRRRLLLKLLAGLGKCMDACGKTEESQKQLVQSIFVLVSRNSFSKPMHLTFKIELLGKDIPEDPFAIERAALLYNICLFTLKGYPCMDLRISDCEIAKIQISDIISWLMLAFVLCREVPVLFQKVSRLLAVVFVLSASTELFSQHVAFCNSLSESHWASYFHQASIGTHVNHQGIIGKERVQGSSSVEDCCVTKSSYVSPKQSMLRLVPETFEDLEGHVSRFFHGFPWATIIGISLLGDPLASLLSKILKYTKEKTPAHAWLLLSRLSSNCQPVVLLLPVDSILKETSDDDTNPCSRVLFEDKEVTKCWHSPWGSTVVDEVAPVFRSILEKSYLSSSGCSLEDTPENRLLWWTQRKGLDQQLGKFTSDLEDLWLGPWKHLLLGEWSGFDNRESVYKKLVRDLKTKCKVDAPESLLKLILGGTKLACFREECVLQLILNKGCLVGGVDHQVSCKALADKPDGIEKMSKKVFKLLTEETWEAKEEDLIREPVILILDYDIQMLPWESLPILRNQEVYRMPSIRSVFATLDRCYQCHDEVERVPVSFPTIDPLDAFYVLNPSGDLVTTQTEFEDWFRDQNLEGKVGTSPTVDELVLALRSHDLYIYIGHGSGGQYIPGYEIQKLENCAATFLMGCSSGSLSLDGCYAPKGAPLSYLLAGSPVIIANLWDVTDKDIDRFGKVMLLNWLKERSAASSSCNLCKKVVTEKFKSMQITETKGNTKKKTSRKNSPKDSDLSTPNYCCNHRPKIGSFLGQARDACTLPFLIGAAPVCYGVPTRIMRKKV